MKPAFEKTPQRQWESFSCEFSYGSRDNAKWHFHPEYQITLVLKGSGYRLVGDKITRLRPGDLVLVGSNLPHVWHHYESHGRSRFAVHSVVVRFLDTFLGRGFLEVPEAAPVRRLLKRARCGLQVTGQTRDAVAAKLERLPDCRGLERVAVLLSILGTLARSQELKSISSPGFVPVLSSDDQIRVERMVAFIHAHFDKPVDRGAVARVAHLSAGAFSRFFKRRLGMTLPRYINELRVGRACFLLAQEKLKITDISLECGFRNLANFNRRFHEITGLTPREYRRHLRQNL